MVGCGCVGGCGCDVASRVADRASLGMTMWWCRLVVILSAVVGLTALESATVGRLVGL